MNHKIPRAKIRYTSKNEFPEENVIFVIGILSKESEHFKDGPFGINCRIVRFIKGIDEEERKKMINGLMDDYYIINPHADKNHKVLPYACRSQVYKLEDENGNNGKNKKNYMWLSPMGIVYNGQEIDKWFYLSHG